MKMHKYIRLNNGEILLTNEIDRSIDLKDAKYCEKIIDLLEVGDLVKIEYFSLRYSKRVSRLFEVDLIQGDRELISLSNAHMDFIIEDGKFIEKYFEPVEPTIISIITKEKLESIEFDFKDMEQLISRQSHSLNTLKDDAKHLTELYQSAYNEFESQVSYIINNNIKDINLIIYVFDQLLNIPYESIYQLFLKLCTYVSDFNMTVANEYINAWNELYGVEESKTNIQK